MKNQFRVATWNVNSIKVRREAVLDWLGRNRPDVLCLQELKTTDDAFPFAELHDAGYHAVINGQKTYNGVAILAIQEPTDVVRGMGDDDQQARLISAMVGNVRVVSAYVPNGAEVDSEKYLYKLAWLARFRDWFSTSFSTADEIVLCGDFNMAGTELDLHRPAEWEGTVIWNPRMREEYTRLTQIGLVDVYRCLNPAASEYSWWDYRMNGFARNNGLRIDYVMATTALSRKAISARIDKAERATERPSDHVPVIVDFGQG